MVSFILALWVASMATSPLPATQELDISLIIVNCSGSLKAFRSQLDRHQRVFAL